MPAAADLFSRKSKPILQTTQLATWTTYGDRRSYIHLCEGVILDCYLLIFIYARDWIDGGIRSHTQLREEVLATGLRRTIVHILISRIDLHEPIYISLSLINFHHAFHYTFSFTNPKCLPVIYIRFRVFRHHYLVKSLQLFSSFSATLIVVSAFILTQFLLLMYYHGKFH
jgi:hypothetical protein